MERASVDTASRDTTDGMDLFRAAALVLSLLVLLVTFAFGVDWLLRSDNFPVHQVRFEGEFKHVKQQQLEAAVMGVVRANFFVLNLDAVKTRVESVPWVYRASVRRQWPQDISVSFTEQQLVAHWGDAAWLNPAGDVVRVGNASVDGYFPRFEGPEGTGPQMLEQYQNLNRILAAAGLKVDRLTLTPRRTWRLTLNNGMALILDREQFEHKLERFARVYKPSLAYMAENIKQVDLRYTNGFAVEWANGRAPGGHKEG